MKIALVQAALIWEEPEKNRIAFSEKLTTVAKDVELIILPEMFTTGFTMNPDQIDQTEGLKTVKWMQELSKEKDAAILGSIVFREGQDYFNRLWFVQPNGELYSYDKRHTFTLAGEDKVYKAGSERLMIVYKGFKICPLICYDLRFPVWARNVEKYDLLIYVANWPEPRIAAWDTLLKARAIENMAYCIGVNRIGADALGHQYCGHSGAYDCLGSQLVFSDKDEITYVRLSKEHVISTREKLRFLEDGDAFTLEV